MPLEGTQDISSRSKYPLTVLSNFTANEFVLDGVECGSLEGFLQSLRVKDPKAQKAMAALVGFTAKKAGRAYIEENDPSRKSMYWQGKRYARNGAPYIELLTRAYRASFDNNQKFIKALGLTGDCDLTHKMGKKDIYQTVITEDEYIDQLYRLRGSLHDLPEELEEVEEKVGKNESKYQSFVDWVNENKVGRVACFTGHRPKKFPFKYNESAPLCKVIKNALHKMCVMSYNRGVRTFITGMALGVDMWAAEILLDMKKNGFEDIVILGAIPCKGQTAKWVVQSSKDRYARICKALDGWMYVDERTYAENGSCMTNRNMAMVDASEITIAVYDGSGGSGTGHCFNYTKSERKTVLQYQWRNDQIVLHKEGDAGKVMVR